MSLGGEKGAVQSAFRRYAQEAGWTYLPPEQALDLRRGITSAVLDSVLVQQLQRLNPGVVHLPRAEELCRQIARVRPTIEGNFDAWQYLKGLKTVCVAAEKRERNLKLLELDDPARNVFHVSDEFTFSNGRPPDIRTDLVFFVNGIPVIVVETKAASKIEGIAEAGSPSRRRRKDLESALAVGRAVDRRAGEAEVGGVRERAHQVVAEIAAGGPVRLVHQCEDVRARDHVGRDLVELVNHRDDQPAPVGTQQLAQVSLTSRDRRVPDADRFEDAGQLLDKYSIRESVADGTTVPLNYALAPNDLQVDRETLEHEFPGLAELEGVSDIEEINKVLEKAVTLRNMLKNAERVDKVAQDVAGHFREAIEPMGYKAFLVAVDREACALYKAALDRYLPAEWSQVVISAGGKKDPAILRKHHLSDEREKEIRKAFRRPDGLPKILIVTEKLLTGYDAPILYCMYLDKPMRDHVLLQAIARVNRPYEDDDGRRKPAGFVLDYVGIFDKLERALAFDSEDVKGVVEGLDVLRQRFTVLMAVRPRELHIRPMTRKWGSCSTNGRVSFNADLLREPAAFRRRVIVEELLHLKIPNHGELFRSLLRAYLGERAALTQPRSPAGAHV